MMSTSTPAAQKNDIFVGNLNFNTTEEQLHQIFSEVGRVVNVRMVLDPETGKMRGFAFVEFEQAQDALAAIRNMNEYELNGRKLRVNFSNSSHLEVLAGKLGMDLSSSTGTSSSGQPSSSASAKPSGAASSLTGTNAVAESLKSFTKGEMYDVVAKFKEIADRDPDEARRLIAGHPQLPEALLFCMSKLDMIKTPLTSSMVEGGGAVGLGGAPAAPAATTATAGRAVDPRAAVARVDPRQARVDPRQQAPRADPRGLVQAPPPNMAPPPPPPQMRPLMAAPPVGYAPMGNSMAPAPATIQTPSGLNLDPDFLQQVLSLTPQQIAQLPPDKQQGILQLRQQITGQPM
jgi:cleavage stimulation factor subunit 2